MTANRRQIRCDQDQQVQDRAELVHREARARGVIAPARLRNTLSVHLRTCACTEFRACPRGAIDACAIGDAPICARVGTNSICGAQDDIENTEQRVCAAGQRMDRANIARAIASLTATDSAR
jgi:hypothetical protein